MRAQDLFDGMPDGDDDAGADWIAPPVVLGPSVLPLRDLGDRRFERLAQWWAEAVDGNLVARLHGPSGRPDYGIDVLARQPNGRYWAYQCKCVKEFKPGHLTTAAAKFFAHGVADIERFTIFVACEGDDTALESELNRLRVAHPGTVIEALYQGNLSNKLQAHPSKVAATFGPEWARAFCGAGHEVGVPTRLRVGDCLPREATHFVGREAHLERALDGLASRTADEAARIVAVTGAPGVGKTALAVRFARRAAKNFPDGQIFLSDSGDGDLPEMLLSIVSDGPSRVGDRRTLKLTLLRNVLSDSRMVVVVDDVRDEGTVRDLVDAAGSDVTFVITSRKKLSGLADLDPIFIDLDVLGPKDSANLVRAVAGADRLTPEQCDRLAAACAGLPLAIRIAASRIARRSQLDVDDYLAQVAHPDQGVAALTIGGRSVAAIIGDSYDALADGQREVLHALGSLPHAIIASHAVVAAIAQQPDGFTEALAQDVSVWLDDLFEASLVEQITTDRFRLHDVLYRYARAKASEASGPQWRSNAIANVCRIYEVIASGQVRRIGFLDAEATKPSPSNAEAIDILDADLPTIRAIAEVARELGLWEQIVTLSQTYSAFLHHRGHLKDFIHIQQLVLRAGQHHDNDTWAAAASVNLAHAAHTSGDNDTAILMLRQAQDLAKRSHNLITFHLAAAVYGNILMERGDNDEAIRNFRKTLPVWKATGNVDMLAQTLCNIGTAHVAAGRWAQGEGYLRNARRTGGGGIHCQQVITDNLAIVLHRSGRGALTRTESREQLTRSRSIGDREGEAYALLRMAETHSSTGDLDAAAELVAQALRLFEEVGNAKGQIRALLDQGKLAAAQGRANDALKALDRCTQLAVDAGDMPTGATAASALAAVLWEVGSPTDAEKWQETAVGLAQSTGNSITVADIVVSHGRALLAQGLASRAAGVLRQAIDLLTPLGDSENLARTHVSIADALVRSGKAHEALPHLNEVLDRDPEATGPALRSYALRVLAGMFLRRGLLAEASEHSDSALMYAERSGSDSQVMECHVVRGHIHMSRSNFREAVTDYDTAIDLARQGKRVNAIISIRGNRAQCFDALGEHDQAIEEIQELIGYCRRLHNTGTETTMLTVLGNMLARRGDDRAAIDTLRTAQSKASANGDEALAAKAALRLAEIYHGRGEHDDAMASARIARGVFVNQADWRSAADATRIELGSSYAKKSAEPADHLYLEVVRKLPAPVRLLLEGEARTPKPISSPKTEDKPSRRAIVIAQNVYAAMDGIDATALAHHLGNSRQDCYLCGLSIAETGTAHLVLLQPQNRRNGDPLWVRIVHPVCGPSAILATSEKQPEPGYTIEIECLIPAPDVAAIVADCGGTIIATSPRGVQGEMLLSILREAGFHDIGQEIKDPQPLEILPAAKVRAELDHSHLTINVDGYPVLDRAPLNFLPAWYAAARKGTIIAIIGRNLQGFSWDDQRSLRRAATNGQVVAAAIPLTVIPPSRNAPCVCQMGTGKKFKRCCGPQASKL